MKIGEQVQNGRNLVAFRWGLVFAISLTIADSVESFLGLDDVEPGHLWWYIGFLFPFVVVFLIARVVDRWYVRNGRVGMYDKNSDSILTLWKAISLVIGLMAGLLIIAFLGLLVESVAGFNILGSPS